MKKYVKCGSGDVAKFKNTYLEKCKKLRADLEDCDETVDFLIDMFNSDEYEEIFIVSQSILVASNNLEHLIRKVENL